MKLHINLLNNQNIIFYIYEVFIMYYFITIFKKIEFTLSCTY